jgi:hypothetical protein
VNPRQVNDLILTPALSLLPAHMDSLSARAMLLSIGLQESRFEHRRQIKGPARGFWQFEVAGLRGVLNHRLTTRPAHDALVALQYREMGAIELHPILEHNDIAAAVIARLLLWTLPQALPARNQPVHGWDQYLDAWRPGKPHSHTWSRFYQTAWEALDE